MTLLISGWVFPHHVRESRQSPTGMYTKQPDLDNLSLRFFSQVIFGCRKLMDQESSSLVPHLRLYLHLSTTQISYNKHLEHSLFYYKLGLSIIHVLYSCLFIPWEIPVPICFWVSGQCVPKCWIPGFVFHVPFCLQNPQPLLVYINVTS